MDTETEANMQHNVQDLFTREAAVSPQLSFPVVCYLCYDLCVGTVLQERLLQGFLQVAQNI